MANKKIGLALSGGGARGFSHVGVLKVLAESGVKIDMVAGTSAGAIAGGAFAAGMTPDEVMAMSTRMTWTNMTRPSLSPLGFLSNAPMGKFVEREFLVKKIEDCPIPFAAVACDFASGEEVVLTTGDLAFAIRASCAVPGVFSPLTDEDGRFLVDGGVISPVPVATVREMGADIVIAVDLMACGATFRSHPRTALGMGLQSAMMLLRAVSRTQHNDADVIITPMIAHLRPDQISKRDEFITLGEQAARDVISSIKQLVE
jgi:NTE family protein